jgi:hypothetical protein
MVGVYLCLTMTKQHIGLKMKQYEIKGIIKTFSISFICFVITVITVFTVVIFDLPLPTETKAIILVAMIASAFSVYESSSIFINDYLSKLCATYG